MTDTPPRYVLGTDCVDTTGIVAGVSGFLARNHALITEAHHFDDPSTNRSFMRTVFHDNGEGMPDRRTLEAAFAQEVAARFGMRFTLFDDAERTRVIIAVSKSSHCLNSMLHRWSTGSLPVQIVAVVSNHPDLRGLVEWHGIPFHYLPIEVGGKAAQEARLINCFDEVAGELLVLARYMQILLPDTCAYFSERAINIHHSFLPSFKGARPYHQAHARGVKIIGATAHYVTTDLDEGPIIEQEVERVDHTMTPDALASVGSDLESLVLNRAVKWHAEHRVFRNGPKTVVLR